MCKIRTNSNHSMLPGSVHLNLFDIFLNTKPIITEIINTEISRIYIM